MTLVKPSLEDNEAFFPLNKEGTKGRIIQLHELQRDGRTLTDINQYQAIREAQRAGGYVFSLAEDWQTIFYARDNQDPKLREFYKSVTSDIRYARWTRTQVHNLRSNCPFVVNVARLHPKYDLPLSYEEDIIEAPWLPKEEGFIQELDEQTGLPRRVGKEPNPTFCGAYFYLSTDLGVVAVIQGRGLGRVPSIGGDWLGVRPAKNFPLEKRLR